MTSFTPTADSPLVVQEYPLKSGPPVETTVMELAEGTSIDRNQRLAGHASLGQGSWGCQGIVNDLRARCARMGEDVLVATPTLVEPDLWFAILTRNGEEIYRVRIGQPALWSEVRALWVWDNHWALETILHDWQAEDGHWTFLRGQISLDGKLMNEIYNYDEAFDFSLVGGKPFFFWQKGDQVGIWYDGQEILLGYEEVPHYFCCSAGTKNPAATMDLVTFFGRRGEQWYYVEVSLPMP
ncbi:MAG: hypothetical protein N2049_02640 [Anaerolineales bacterium]|nr:hypothetical protein [Anaerolineales bacterium]